jgi:hypothetical protein
LKWAYISLVAQCTPLAEHPVLCENDSHQWNHDSSMTPNRSRDQVRAIHDSNSSGNRSNGTDRSTANNECPFSMLIHFCVRSGQTSWGRGEERPRSRIWRIQNGLKRVQPRCWFASSVKKWTTNLTGMKWSKKAEDAIRCRIWRSQNDEHLHQVGIRSVAVKCRIRENDMARSLNFLGNCNFLLALVRRVEANSTIFHWKKSNLTLHIDESRTERQTIKLSILTRRWTCALEFDNQSQSFDDPGKASENFRKADKTAKKLWNTSRIFSYDERRSFFH